MVHVLKIFLLDLLKLQINAKLKSVIWYHINMTQTFADTCYFCDQLAEYNQVVKIENNSYTVSGVCKDHLEMGLSA